MSYWTYVNGLVQVSVPGRTQKEKEYLVDTVLNHLPLITGSEGPCHTHLVQAYGQNSHSNVDEFLNRSNLLPDHYGTVGTCNGWLGTQDTYYVVVEGALRDRMFPETARETAAWISRLSKRLLVRYCHVDVSSDTGDRIAYTNKNNWLRNNYVSGDKAYTYGLTWKWVELQDGTHTWNTLLREEHALQSDS